MKIIKFNKKIIKTDRVPFRKTPYIEFNEHPHIDFTIYNYNGFNDKNVVRELLKDISDLNYVYDFLFNPNSIHKNLVDIKGNLFEMVYHKENHLLVKHEIWYNGNIIHESNVYIPNYHIDIIGSLLCISMNQCKGNLLYINFKNREIVAQFSDAYKLYESNGFVLIKKKNELCLFNEYSFFEREFDNSKSNDVQIFEFLFEVHNKGHLVFDYLEKSYKGDYKAGFGDFDYSINDEIVISKNGSILEIIDDKVIIKNENGELKFNNYKEIKRFKNISIINNTINFEVKLKYFPFDLLYAILKNEFITDIYDFDVHKVESVEKSIVEYNSMILNLGDNFGIEFLKQLNECEFKQIVSNGDLIIIKTESNVLTIKGNELVEKIDLDSVIIKGDLFVANGDKIDMYGSFYGLRKTFDNWKDVTLYINPELKPILNRI